VTPATTADVCDSDGAEAVALARYNQWRSMVRLIHEASRRADAHWRLDHELRRSGCAGIS
jgi:hypothetical protein